ncbi:LOW QUALITY PROTEIN: hypothetical protein M8C21_029548, partial [Ambrosia artemisiifolia]
VLRIQPVMMGGFSEEVSVVVVATTPRFSYRNDRSSEVAAKTLNVAETDLGLTVTGVNWPEPPLNTETVVSTPPSPGPHLYRPNASSRLFSDAMGQQRPPPEEHAAGHMSVGLHLFVLMLCVLE